MGELTHEICSVDMVLPAYGGDLLTVNAGRVSYDRWHNELTWRDLELIQEFAASGDTSPFYHAHATFRITAPLPVIRQLTRHTVGFSAPNEVSRRHTSRNIVVHSPEVWRGADGNTMDWVSHSMGQEILQTEYEASVTRAVDTYEWMIARGVAREQARMVLPQGMMVTVLWTGSLYAWVNLVRKRADPRAQPETQSVAHKIAEHMAAAFPVAWQALMTNDVHGQTGGDSYPP